MTEHAIQNAIQRAFGTCPDMRLWRANTGAAVVGDVARIMAVCRRLGIPCRLVRFGVPGQADLTGILGDGRRLEIEVKTPTGRVSPEQVAFGALIERMGGVYVLARCVEDVAEAIRPTAVTESAENLALLRDAAVGEQEEGGHARRRRDRNAGE